MTKESIKYLQEKLSKCNDDNLRRAFEMKIKELKGGYQDTMNLIKK